MISNVHFAFLKILSEERDPYVRKVLLFSFMKDKKFIKALRSLCKNTLKGKFSISPQLRKRYLKDLELFTDKKASRKKISQNGAGFLSILFPIVASVIGPLINGALSKNDDGPH